MFLINVSIKYDFAGVVQTPLLWNFGAMSRASALFQV